MESSFFDPDYALQLHDIPERPTGQLKISVLPESTMTLKIKLLYSLIGVSFIEFQSSNDALDFPMHNAGSRFSFITFTR